MPGGQALWKRERQRDVAVAISLQGGVAEGSLVEILTELYLLFLLFILTLYSVACHNDFFQAF